MNRVPVRQCIDMCGIAGIFDQTASLPAESLIHDAGCMAQHLQHRGPDDHGVWADAFSGICLAHRRLAIVDLSPDGHQPMHSSCGRYVVAFNGEIYNFRLLRAELERLGQAFRSHSDTEVVLAAVSQWGLDRALARFAGMFAFVLWDRQAHRIYLVRDRLGEKPLYYGWHGQLILFASELAALRAYPGWRGEVNRDVLALYLRHGCVPAPHTIYRGVRKVRPGTYVVSSENSTETKEVVYWSGAQTIYAGAHSRLSTSEAEMEERLELNLKQVIAEQMLADVPVGAFLSGGVDSSLIVALMQEQGRIPVKTFTIGFSETAYDEATHARRIAQHLGTEHTELYVSPQDALEIIPRLPEIYDEPFADSSQIPTYLVARLARQHVKVALSGDGGDEVFGGYNRYIFGDRLWNVSRRLPRALRGFAGTAIRAVSPRRWDRILGKRRMRHGTTGEKLHKAADAFDAVTPEEWYRRLTSQWQTPDHLVNDGREPETPWVRAIPDGTPLHFVERMMYWDMSGYLADDILVKLDRAAMSVSLETRAPFLDPRVVELAWRLPLSVKLRNGCGKWILRQLLYKRVPRKLLERPKAGFALPLDSWLRGPLREWAETLMDRRQLQQEGYLRPEPIIKVWQEHLSGRYNRQHLLWNVLMFQSWLQRQHGR